MASWRKRIEQSQWLATRIGGGLARWIRFCHRHTRWTAHGLDDLRADLARGPVIVVLWHEHLLMGPAHWPADAGDLTGIRDPSPMGRIAGAVQAAFGLGAAAMSQRQSNVIAARAVLEATRSGTSIAITADGPTGPRGGLKTAPLDWARAAGVPIYIYAWTATRAKRLRTWDRMLVPLPFARGHYRFERWSDPLPRRVEAAARDHDLAVLQAALVRVSDAVDARRG